MFHLVVFGYVVPTYINVVERGGWVTKAASSIGREPDESDAPSPDRDCILHGYKLSQAMNINVIMKSRGEEISVSRFTICINQTVEDKMDFSVGSQREGHRARFTYQVWFWLHPLSFDSRARKKPLFECSIE